MNHPLPFFSYGFSEEMCVNYVHYYPRVELEVCKSDVDAKALDDYFRFANDFDGQARVMYQETK